MSELLSVYSFGAALLRAKDLDPIYAVAHHANFSPDVLRKWLLAYWCFYDSGTACWVADHRHDYWARMFTAAASSRYPRGRERRHFRAKNALDSVAWLKAKGEELFSWFDREKYDGRALTADEVTDYVQEWKGFGPWIAFKVADMLERLGVVRVSFSSADLLFFDSPRQGANLLWEREGRPAGVKETSRVSWAVNRVLARLTKLDEPYNLAPPRYDRPLNVQEAETVLCKWKSYLGGHYRVGEDVEGLRESLLRFSKTPLAQSLLSAGSKGGLW